MNNTAVPMDVDRARASNRGGQNNWRGGGFGNRGGARGSNWRRNNAYGNRAWTDPTDEADLNAVQTPPPPRYCYECGQAGHFKQECPQKKQRFNANLVEFDGFEDDPEQRQEKPAEHVARLRAEVDAMSEQEKAMSEQEKAMMLDQFGDSQDFSSA
jgi:hypothetical protein